MNNNLLLIVLEELNKKLLLFMRKLKVILMIVISLVMIPFSAISQKRYKIDGDTVIVFTPKETRKLAIKLLEGEKYENVKDALEKLQVNDAALEFELETSAALGFGFRCGFLGLLHLEIIEERLEREFNLNLVTTAPSVIYRLTKNTGEVVMIQNPNNLPDPSEIKMIEEPIVKADILVPKDFVGLVIELCQE